MVRSHSILDGVKGQWWAEYLSNPLIRPYSLGGSFGGGTLDSHETKQPDSPEVVLRGEKKKICGRCDVGDGEYHDWSTYPP